jgi:4-hydroxyproline epimerase
VACLAADGKLLPGEIFRQESIVGSIFEASYEQLADGSIQPTIIGTAYVNAEGELLLDPHDPFCHGIPT